MKLNNQRRIQDLAGKARVFQLGRKWLLDGEVNSIPVPEGQALDVQPNSEAKVRVEETAAMVPPHTEGKER